MSKKNLFSMDISSIGNAAFSSDWVIQFLIATYLSFSLIYKIPSVGNIIIYKQILSCNLRIIIHIRLILCLQN